VGRDDVVVEEIARLTVGLEEYVHLAAQVSILATGCRQVTLALHSGRFG
jgi:hypothetical protein